MSDFESTSDTTDQGSAEDTGLEETAPGSPQREDSTESGYEPTSSDTDSSGAAESGSADFPEGTSTDSGESTSSMGSEFGADDGSTTGADFGEGTETGSAPQEGLGGSGTDQSLQEENAETSLDQPSDG